MINSKVQVQFDGKQLYGRVVGQSLLGNPLDASTSARMFLMVELGEETPDQPQGQAETTIAIAISGLKHVWVSENDAQALLELGLVPIKGSDKLRSKAFGMFNGVKVNVDANLMMGEYYTLDGKMHRV